MNKENNESCDWCYTNDEMIEIAVAHGIEVIGCDYCMKLASRFRKKGVNANERNESSGTEEAIRSTRRCENKLDKDLRSAELTIITFEITGSV